MRGKVAEPLLGAKLVQKWIRQPSTTTHKMPRLLRSDMSPWLAASLIALEPDNEFDNLFPSYL